MKMKTSASVACILLIVFTAFYPCLRNGFCNVDDDCYVYRNPLITNFSWNGIARIFVSAGYTVLYTPLVFLSYAIEYHYFELNPFPYHLTNLILHMCNCVLAFWFVFALARSIPLAFATALLFGIHPLRVESVAWITERKDVLYAFFFLGALVCYLRRRSRRTRGSYCLLVLFFILAILSKPVALVLPFALLLCDYYLEGAVRRADLLEKIPLFAIAALALCLGILSVRQHLGAEAELTALDYFCIGCYAALFYLFKSLIPAGLSCLYPYPLKMQGHLQAVFLLSPLVVAALALLTAWSGRRTRKVIFGGLFFLITVSPALRMFPPGLIIVADRYTYLPSLGLAFIAAALITCGSGRGRGAAALAAVVLVAVIGALSFLTWNRCSIWKDNLALWDDAVNKCPHGYIPIAYFNRGIASTDRGAYDRAVSDFSRSLALYYGKRGISGDPAARCRAMLAEGSGYPAVYACIAGRFEEIRKRTEALGCIYVAWRAWGPSDDTRRTLIRELDAWRARETQFDRPRDERAGRTSGSPPMREKP